MEKTCTKCEEVKPLEEFHNTNRTLSGKVSKCKTCVSAYHAQWQLANRETKSQKSREYHAANKNRRHAVQRLARYGISHERYIELLANRDGKCAICGRPPRGKRKSLVIDHDHTCCSSGGSCGKCVRDLLCHTCNVAIAYMEDSPEVLEAAAQYVRDHRKKGK